MKKSIFWIFGILQSLALSVIIFLLFRALNTINGAPVIGWDTHVLISIAFPVFLLIVQYITYVKKG